MRVIGTFIATLLLSLTTLAATYSGQGTWKSSSGLSGDYLVEANIELGIDDTVTINQTLALDGEVLNMSLVLRRIDDTFFEVIDEEGQVVGSGYCWPLETEEAALCHSVSHYEDYVIESTIKGVADAIYRMGSKTDLASGDKIIWKDVLELQSKE